MALEWGGRPILLFWPRILPQRRLTRVFVAMYNASRWYDSVRHTLWRLVLAHSSNPTALRMGSSGRFPLSLRYSLSTGRKTGFAKRESSPAARQPRREPEGRAEGLPCCPPRHGRDPDCTSGPSLIYFRQRLVIQRLMQPFLIIKLEIIPQTHGRLHHRFIFPKVEVFIFDRPPKTFDKNVVIRTPATVHADLDL